MAFLPGSVLSASMVRHGFNEDDGVGAWEEERVWGDVLQVLEDERMMCECASGYYTRIVFFRKGILLSGDLLAI